MITKGSISMVESIRRSRLSQQIVTQICQMIRQQRIQTGERLPPERELADQLQVSRASLREALRVLEISGIVESRHGGGTYVADLSEATAISPLALVMETSDDAIGDLLEMRIIIEPAVAEMASIRATPKQVERLDDILRQQRLALQSGEADLFLSLDQSFHRTLATATGNDIALRILDLIQQLLQDGRRHFIGDPERRMRAYTAHRQILDAVREHDPSGARESMRRHLESVDHFVAAEHEREEQPGVDGNSGR